MSRRTLALVAVLTLAAAIPAGADHLEENSPPDPAHRVNAIVPKAPGTFDTLVLQYGPYLVHPGSDLTRVDVEPVAHDFQVIAARPAVRMLDGSEPTDKDVHIHHAHWIKPNASSPQYYDWFFGTGEEKTRGGGWGYMRADASTWDSGVRFGVTMHRGEQMAFISMLHNKTAEALPLWIEGRFEVVWGSREEIRAATAGNPDHPLWNEGGGAVDENGYASDVVARGIDVRPLTPVLHGDTFQVPKVGTDYVYPRDVGSTPDDPNAGSVLRAEQISERNNGVFDEIGHVWTAPEDGVIVIGAGHLHPGGKQVIVSNLGSLDSPCGADQGAAFLDDVDGDGFPGKRILAIDAYYRTEDDAEFPTADEVAGTKYFPSEEFQMGITQQGWHAVVRAGDRLAINGIYDASTYAFPDAMSFFGFYMDTEADLAQSGGACAVALAGDPAATPAQITASVPNRPWETGGEHGHAHELWCEECDDPSREVTTLGEWSPIVHIAGFLYTPGDVSTIPMTGVPWVNRGESITFINDDWAELLVRHSITTCAWPCNGPYTANYPFHDGVVDSGSIGFTPVETYETGTDEPVWTMDTAELDPGLYAYYCRLHPWMRGTFGIVDPAA